MKPSKAALHTLYLRRKAVESCIPALTKTVSKVLRDQGAYTDDLRDEIVQACVVHAMEYSLPRYNGSGSFEGWLCYCARNKARNLLRDYRRNGWRNDSLEAIEESTQAPGIGMKRLAYSGPVAAQVLSDGHGVHRAVDAIDRQREVSRLQAALATLTDEERFAIDRLAQGDRPSDVANLCGRSPSWVSKLRTKLAAMIRE